MSTFDPPSGPGPAQWRPPPGPPGPNSTTGPTTGPPTGPPGQPGAAYPSGAPSGSAGPGYPTGPPPGPVGPGPYSGPPPASPFATIPGTAPFVGPASPAKSSPPWLPAATLIGAVAAALIGFVAFSGGGSGDTATGVATQPEATVLAATPGVPSGAPGEIFLEPLTETGPLPFTPSVDTTPPGAVVPIAGQPLAPAVPFPPAAVPAGAASGTTQAISGNAPGLYGGTLSETQCDKEKLISFLETEPAKAAAWAAVHGIAPGDIRSFVDGLTPFVLRTDTRVTNHGFDGAAATPRQAVLQAGTAVLVDRFGVPRVRCYCGNPLTEPLPQAAPTFAGPAWLGFDPGTVTVVAPAPQPIDTFIFVDVATGAPVNRAAGSTGSADALAPPDALVASPTPVPTPPPATAVPSPTSTPSPSPLFAGDEITADGTVGVSSEYPGGEYPASLAFDGDETTSWFSAGDADSSCQPITPGVSCSELRWTYREFRDVPISGIDIIDNSRHPDFPTGFGFGSVTVIVTDISGAVVAQETVEMPGEDFDIFLTLNAVGNSVRLVFEGHDSPDCGGISELRILG